MPHRKLEYLYHVTERATHTPGSLYRRVLLAESLSVALHIRYKFAFYMQPPTRRSGLLFSRQPLSRVRVPPHSKSSTNSVDYSLKALKVPRPWMAPFAKSAACSLQDSLSSEPPQQRLIPATTVTSMHAPRRLRLARRGMPADRGAQQSGAAARDRMADGSHHHSR
jgi:hypothetical protein